MPPCVAKRGKGISLLGYDFGNALESSEEAGWRHCEVYQYVVVRSRRLLESDDHLLVGINTGHGVWYEARRLKLPEKLVERSDLLRITAINVNAMPPADGLIGETRSHGEPRVTTGCLDDVKIDSRH